MFEVGSGGGGAEKKMQRKPRSQRDTFEVGLNGGPIQCNAYICQCSTHFFSLFLCRCGRLRVQDMEIEFPLTWIPLKFDFQTLLPMTHCPGNSRVRLPAQKVRSNAECFNQIMARSVCERAGSIHTRKCISISIESAPRIHHAVHIA